jgi:hypothetical protein
LFSINSKSNFLIRSECIYTTTITKHTGSLKTTECNFLNYNPYPNEHSKRSLSKAPNSWYRFWLDYGIFWIYKMLVKPLHTISIYIHLKLKSCLLDYNEMSHYRLHNSDRDFDTFKTLSFARLMTMSCICNAIFLFVNAFIMKALISFLLNLFLSKKYFETREILFRNYEIKTRGFQFRGNVVKRCSVGKMYGTSCVLDRTQTNINSALIYRNTASYTATIPRKGDCAVKRLKVCQYCEAL